MSFDDAVKHWSDAERACIKARMAYEQAYAAALISANGKSAEIRTAQADLLTIELLRDYQLAAVEARAAEHTVLFMRGSHPNAELERSIATASRYPGATAP